MKRIKERSFLEFSYVIVQYPKGYRGAGFGSDGGKLVETDLATDPEEAEREVIQKLSEMSEDFVGLDGARKLFLKAFPEGFHSDFYMDYERKEKDRAVALARELLDQTRMAVMLEEGGAEALFEDVLKVLNKGGFLFSHFELMNFRDGVRSRNLQESFCRALFDHCYGENFSRAFGAFVEFLKPLGAAKWPIATYFPFVLFPERHMFLKPEVTKRCAERMGHDLDYHSEPNIGTYERLLDLVEHIDKGISSLEPRDNIDVQGLMYAVGSEGFVRDAIAARLGEEPG